MNFPAALNVYFSKTSTPGLPAWLPRGLTELGFVPSPKFNRTLLPGIEKGVRRKAGDDFLFENREVPETEKT